MIAVMQQKDFQRHQHHNQAGEKPVGTPRRYRDVELEVTGLCVTCLIVILSEYLTTRLPVLYARAPGTERSMLQLRTATLAS